MKIIAFEGLDKSGKATLSRYVADYLESKGYTVGHMDFHRYSTPTGELIKKWLYREYNVSQETIELIMAADKVAAKTDFDMLREEGYDYLILDRYKWSQYVYSQAAGFNHEWAVMLQDMIEEPYMTVYMDVSPETSMKRQGKHGDNDRYESDKDLLATARAYYLELVHQNIESEKVICLDGEDDLEQIKARLLIQLAHKLDLPTTS